MAIEHRMTVPEMVRFLDERLPAVRAFEDDGRMPIGCLSSGLEQIQCWLLTEMLRQNLSHVSRVRRA